MVFSFSTVGAKETVDMVGGICKFLYNNYKIKETTELNMQEKQKTRLTSWFINNRINLNFCLILN